MSTDPSSYIDEKVYNGVIDLSVKNNAHTKAFDLIVEDCHGRAGRILEVGCASGYFGAVLRQHGHEVWGIEVSPQAASVARGRLDYVYVGTVEEFLASDRVQDVSFDYIVFGDVLEHLVDLAQILRGCLKILTPAGGIVASIPNVAHLAVRLMLLEGRWEYSQFGLLDSTHLRFFTRTSLLEMFSDAGFAVANLDTVRLPVEEVGIEINPGLLRSVPPLISDNTQDVFQYVLLAKKASDTNSIYNNMRFLPENALRILCLLPLVDWSLGNIRIKNPLEKWQQKYGGLVRIQSMYDFQYGDLMWADVVILQRESSIYVLDLITKLQSLGKKILFDIDDLLTDVPHFLSVHTHAIQTKPYLEQALRMVDAITVPTERLKERLKVYNKNIYVVPNCSSTNNVYAKHYDSNNGLITLIVASSDTIRVDFIVPVLKRLIANSDLKLRLIGIGPPGEYLTDTGLVIECYKTMPYDQFRLFLSSLDNVIGIIPLDDSIFSSCKSAIKFVDYSLAGVPTVCSALAPYSDVIGNGMTGVLVANDEDAWYEAIKRLALSTAERKRLATAARTYCLDNFSLKKAADGWHEVFSTVKAGQGEPVTVGSFRRQLLLWQMRALVSRYCTRPTAYKAALRILIKEGPRGLKARFAREF